MPSNRQLSRRRRLNGDGSVYKRQDGYWVGAFYAYTTSGARKRVVVYGKTLDEARAKLGKAQEQARSGVPVPDESWKLGPYLHYWLEHVVKHNRRPATYALYEYNIRLYLVPGLGTCQLNRLSVSAVQMFLNQRIEKGDSVRKVQVMRTVLSAALTRAVREELIPRNVVRLVELPEWHRTTIRPWTVDEAKRFLTAARSDPLYAAFLLLILYGLRRASSYSVSAASCCSAPSRPEPASAICRFSILHVMRSPGRLRCKPSIVPTWARPGLVSIWCSRPGPGGRSSRATSSDHSAASARTTRSA